MKSRPAQTTTHSVGMTHTAESIRAALAAIDADRDRSYEYHRVARELSRADAIISRGRIRATERHHIGGNLRRKVSRTARSIGVPLYRELTPTVIAELESYATGQRNIAAATEASIPAGETIADYRVLMIRADTATARADAAAALARRLKMRVPRSLFRVGPYRATGSERMVLRLVLETLARRLHEAASTATEDLDPAK